MKKLIALAFLLAPPSVFGAFKTDWLQNTSSSFTVNGTTYTWNVGAGGANRFIQNVNGLLTSELVVAGGGGSSLAVDDDGVQISSPTGTINFVGAGVTVTAQGSSSATITIPGGGMTPGSTDYIQNRNTLQDGASFYVNQGVFSGAIGVATDTPRAPVHVVANQNEMFRFERDFAGSDRAAVIGISQVGAGITLYEWGYYGTNAGVGARDGSGLDVWRFIRPFGTFGATLRLYDDDSSHYVALRSSGVVASSVTFTLPAEGSAGQVLHTNGAGDWYFDTDDSGGGGTTIAVQDGGSTIVNTSTINANADQFIITDDSGKALFTLNAASVTLQGNNLSATYLTNSSATANYLTLSSAAVTYLNSVTGAATYLTQSSATATYFNKNSVYVASLTASAPVTVTGTNNASAAAPIIGIDKSSVTVQGVITAGSNITLTPGAGTLTIAASGSGGGSSIYAATGTILAPYGIRTSSIEVTGAGGSFVDIGTNTALGLVTNGSTWYFNASSITYGGTEGLLGTNIRVSSFPAVNGNVGSFTNANITVNAQGFVTAAANGSAGGGGSTIWGQDDEAVVSNSVSTITVNGVLKSTVTTSSKMAIFLNYDTAQFTNNASTFTANASTFTMLGQTIDISANTNLTASNGVVLTGDALSVDFSSVSSRADIKVASVTAGASITITGTNNVPNAAPIFNVNPASVTTQGVATAGQNISVTNGAGTHTIGITGVIPAANLVSTVAYTTDSSTESFTFSISSTSGLNSITIPGIMPHWVEGSTITAVYAQTMPVGSTVTFSLESRPFGALGTSSTTIFAVQYSTANSDGIIISSFSSSVAGKLISPRNNITLVTPPSATAGTPSWLNITVWFQKRRN